VTETGALSEESITFLNPATFVSMLYYGALTAFLASSLFANAYHNVTYNDNDPAIIYQPPQAWLVL